MINLSNPSQQETVRFSVCYERAAGTFVNTTEYHDCCEFLTTQTNFTPVTTADALEVVSSSVNDTSAGTGTRTVGIIYLDSTGIWSQAVVTMNGTTPVTVPITASAIISMSALTGGSSPVSIGNISLRKVGTPTTIYEYIAANGNQSQSGRFTVPKGYYAILRDMHVSVQGQPIEIKLRTTRNEFDGSNAERYLFKSGIKLASGGTIPLILGQKLDAGQHLKVSGIVDATGGNPKVHGTLDLDLIKL